MKRFKYMNTTNNLQNFYITKIEREHYDMGYMQVLNQLSNRNPKINVTKQDFNKYLALNELLLSDNRKHILVLVDRLNNKVVGTGSLLVESKLLHAISKVGHIEDVVIDQKYRGKGLARLLISHLVNLSKDEKCYKVVLYCSDQISGFYEKLGFSKNGQHMDIYY